MENGEPLQACASCAAVRGCMHVVRFLRGNRHKQTHTHACTVQIHTRLLLYTQRLRPHAAAPPNLQVSFTVMYTQDVSSDPRPPRSEAAGEAAEDSSHYWFVCSDLDSGSKRDKTLGCSQSLLHIINSKNNNLHDRRPAASLSSSQWAHQRFQIIQKHLIEIFN